MIRSLSSQELRSIMGARSAAGFGSLDTERGCLPLESLAVATGIEGLTAHTAVRQRFFNVFQEPLEATYIFPLPPRSAVVDFHMTVEGREVAGVILERDRAREAYEDAVAQGKSAAITEEERPNIFTLRVGNIPAGCAIDVQFQLVEQVSVDEGEATYRFPLVVAPRYCPGRPLDGEPVGDGTLADTCRVPDASRISPPVLLPGMPSPIALSMTARFARGPRSGAVAGGRVACSLSVNEIHGEDGSYVVDVCPEQELDRDFILRWPVAEQAASTVQVLLEPNGACTKGGLVSGEIPPVFAGDGTFCATIMPPADVPDKQRPRDIVILLDRSGSMGGWKMAAARRAVASLVDSLSPQDRIEVVAFDTHFEALADTPTLTNATSDVCEQITEWLATVRARGGTELAGAVTRGLDLLAVAPADEAASPREHSLVVITDGHIGGESEVLQRLSSGHPGVRVYAVGIDTAVNDSLLGRMAETTGGLAELVESEERLDAVMDRIRRRLGWSLVSQLMLRGEGIELVEDALTPSRIPDLVPGLPAIVRGRYRCVAGSTDPRIVVSGVTGSGEAWSEAASAETATTPGLMSLWGRDMLRTLQDSVESRRAVSGGRNVRDEIVALSLGCGVLCRYTAVVAIDPRDPDGRCQKAPPRRIVMPANGVLRFGLQNLHDERALHHQLRMGHAVEIHRAREPAEFVAEESTRGGSFRGGSFLPISRETHAAEMTWQTLWQRTVALRTDSGRASTSPATIAAETLLFETVSELHRLLRRLKPPGRYTLLKRLASLMQAVIDDPGEIDVIRVLNEAVQAAGRRKRRRDPV